MDRDGPWAEHKEGLDFLPTSACEPLLTTAQKKAGREEQVNSVTLGDLCDQYLAHIQIGTASEVSRN